MIYKINFLNKNEIKKIKKFIIDNEKRIKSLGPDEYAGTKEDSLTGRYKVYNYMYDLPGKIILPKFKELFKSHNMSFPISIQSWANMFRKNEGIAKHKHYSFKDQEFLCANLFICGDINIGTNFIINNKDIHYKNTVGEIMFFKSNLEHYVKNNKKNNIRITMSFDIYFNKEMEDLKRFYILK